MPVVGDVVWALAVGRPRPVRGEALRAGSRQAVCGAVWSWRRWMPRVMPRPAPARAMPPSAPSATEVASRPSPGPWTDPLLGTSQSSLAWLWQ